MLAIIIRVVWLMGVADSLPYIPTKPCLLIQSSAWLSYQMLSSQGSKVT